MIKIHISSPTGKGFDALTQEIRNKIKGALNEQVDLLYNAVYDRASIEDFDGYKELHEADHPYAERHQENYAVTKGGHTDDYINTQKGKLLKKIKKSVKVTRSIAAGSVYVNVSDVPYIKWLVEGTDLMRPRPIFMKVRDENEDKVFNITKKYLGG